MSSVDLKNVLILRDPTLSIVTRRDGQEMSLCEVKIFMKDGKKRKMQIWGPDAETQHQYFEY